MGNTNFTEDEVSIIRSAARVAWTKMSAEYKDTVEEEDECGDITTMEIIHAVAMFDDIGIILCQQGHCDLAGRFSELDADEIEALLLPEFNLQ